MLGVVFRKAQNRIQDPAKLRRLIVDLIDRETWLTLDADVKGDAYEGLLEKNAEDVKSGAGQYFTPRPLIRALVEVMRPEPGMTICDPACGTGGFLLAAHSDAQPAPLEQSGTPRPTDRVTAFSNDERVRRGSERRSARRGRARWRGPFERVAFAKVVERGWLCPRRRRRGRRVPPKQSRRLLCNSFSFQENRRHLLSSKVWKGRSAGS